MKYYVGIDIGGTNTKIGVVDADANVFLEQHIKTQSIDGAEKTFTRIWETIVSLSEQLSLDLSNLVGIGMGIPGPVVDNAIVKIAANFSWGNDFNAKQLMEQISGKPVFVENDVRTIALGEKLFGACKRYDNAIVIPIGTGIASGIIVNGKVLSGSSGFAGEFGHIMVNEHGQKCGCGLIGCLETYVSGPGLIREAKAHMLEQRNGLMFTEFQNKLDEFEAYHVFKYAELGDSIANLVLDNFAKHLAYGLGVLVNLLNPEVIVLAGGLAKSAEQIIQRVNQYLPKYALGISLPHLKITKAELADSAGIKGAAALILQHYTAQH